MGSLKPKNYTKSNPDELMIAHSRLLFPYVIFCTDYTCVVVILWTCPYGNSRDYCCLSGYPASGKKCVDTIIKLIQGEEDVEYHLRIV